jgi:hypothetical protein
MSWAECLTPKSPPTLRPHASKDAVCCRLAAMVRSTSCRWSERPSACRRKIMAGRTMLFVLDDHDAKLGETLCFIFIGRQQHRVASVLMLHPRRRIEVHMPTETNMNATANNNTGGGRFLLHDARRTTCDTTGARQRRSLRTFRQASVAGFPPPSLIARAKPTEGKSFGSVCSMSP